MGHPLRDRNPAHYRLVTARTLEAAILMVPSEQLNRVLGGILARYAELFSITLYAYCILGNHLHLLLKAPEANLDEFMENVLREIARRVNWEIRRRGTFWARRYDDQVIQTLNDLEEAFLYVVTNPVKHGLVSKSCLWPGLGCYEQLLSEEGRRFPFVFRSKRDATGHPVVVHHTLTLAPLPQYEALPKGERVAVLKKKIAEREECLQDSRARSGQGFLNPETILSQVPGRLPITVSYSPRPICYTKDPLVRREYKVFRREFRRHYREASERFRAGEYSTEFPRHCYKPPAHRVPKGLVLQSIA